jgi:hypothetical protein
VRDEADYKRIVGKQVIPVCHRRLLKAEPIKNQAKFFKLIAVLIKRCKENINLARGQMKDTMVGYMKQVRDQEVLHKLHHIIVLVDTAEDY